MKKLDDLWLVKNWKLIFLISLFLVSCPVLFYIISFSSFNISNNPEHWGVFGDYIGGVLNPIISLLSLIVLAILTWLVGKQSNKENYKLSLKRLRIDVLEEFGKNMINLVEYETEIFRVISFIGEVHGKELNGREFGRILENQFRVLEEKTRKVSEARIFFSHVFVTKNHLFKYNFENSIFQSFVKAIVDYDDICLKAMNKVKLMAATNSMNSENLQNEIAEIIENRESRFKRFGTLYKTIIKDLKIEVDT